MRANSSVGGAGKRLCGGTGQTGPDRMSLSQVINLISSEVCQFKFCNVMYLLIFVARGH